MQKETTGAKIIRQTFFCGVIHEVKLQDKGVVISNGHEEYRLSSSNDPALPFLVVGRRRLIVIVNERVAAVYIRPRISLINKMALGVIISKAELLRNLPIYPKGVLHVSEKDGK